MPRIDPLQLLKCLSVLLSPTGGIKSKEEVQRLASLMTKFSKKLVSKCIYIQILKTTKTDLLGMFMAAGGWTLIHTWLSDAIVAKNWPLIQELLELLLMCPVDVERLKANNCPKLIKGLSKENSNESVKLLSSKLVEQWLKIVKGETEAVRAHHLASSDNKTSEVSRTESKVPVSDSESACVTIKEEPSDELQGDIVNKDSKVGFSHTVKEESLGQVKTDIVEPKVELQKVKIKTEDSTDESDSQADQLPVYKITIRDGKQVLAKVSAGEKSNRKASADSISSAADDKTEGKYTVNTTFVNDVSVKKEETQDEIPVKPSTESPKTLVSKSKVKAEKLESNVDGMKSSKDIIKKSKDAHSVSKTSDKEKKLKVDSSKEKSREKDISKEKSKDKTKSKEREKIKGITKKESDKAKEKKADFDRNNGPSEKDKAMLAKLIPPTISKLGKIPKKPRTDEPKPKTEESQKPSGEVKKPSSGEIRKPPPLPEPSRKPSISIECRKPNDASRPKTVKTFNSKFRSTGLEQEVKPPPARPIKKNVVPLDKKPVKLPPLKRPSPPKEFLTPPEKKLKSTLADITPEEAKKNEKSGGLKLIPLRPKPSFLQESDMFMDALNASSKKEPRKRKRRISSSKDGPEAKKETASGKEEEPKESTPPTSPNTTNEDSKSPPIVRPLFKFYQETMGTNDDDDEKDDDDDEIKDIGRKIDKDMTESKIKSEEGEEDQQSSTSVQDDGSENEPNGAVEGSDEITSRLVKQESTEDGSEESKTSSDDTPGRYPKGVLIYHKTRKGPKKVVKWKEEKDLFNIKYFELDETERVNVTKTFLDMQQIERVNEREAFILSRKLPQDDIMEEKTTYQPLIPIDLPPSLVESGVRSREKDVQYAREKVILQALYFNRNMIPDSAAEPDLEIHATTDPVIIPLDDVTGNPDSVNDFQNTPWPEPKPMIIPQSPPPQFQQPQPPFGSFPNQGFPGSPIYPNQPVIANNMPMPGGMIVPNSMNNMSPMGGMNSMDSGSGDWRTGDGKIIPVNDMPMPMDMYNPVGPPMGMGMPGMPGMVGPGPVPGPEMNYMMGPGAEEMGPGGPYPPPPQGFPMPGPHPGMYPPYRGGGGGGGGRGPNMGGGMRGGRNNQMGSRGPNSSNWYRSGGPHGWQGGGSGGSGGRGNRGWGGQNRSVCKHFRSGFCRQGEKCPFLHPGVNGPQY